MNNKLVLHLIAFVIVVIWGSTLVSSKVLLEIYHMREEEIFFARMVIAYIAIWFISPKQLFSNTKRDEFMMFLLGVTGGSLYFLAENFALPLTTANNVAFIVAVSPLVTVLLAIMFNREMHMTQNLAIGSIMALVGVALVVFLGKGESEGITFSPIGDLLALLATFSFGLYCLLLKKLGDRYSSVFITRKVFGYGMLTTLPLFIFRPWQFPLNTFFENPSILFNILFLGLVASFLCFFLWSVVTKKLGACATANYIYISPVATIIVSWLVLGEKMTLMGWIGSALILSGVVLANKDIEE